MPLRKEANTPEFEALVDAYQHLMHRVAEGILHDYHYAEDVVSEALRKIYLHLPRFSYRSEKELEAWVLVITRRTAIDWKRKLDRRCEVSLDPRQPAPERSLEMRCLMEALQSLPVAQYQVIFMRYYIGYTCEEVAKITGYSLNRVYKIIERGKKKLAARLREELEL